MPANDLHLARQFLSKANGKNHFTKPKKCMKSSEKKFKCLFDE